ncbi:RlmE family RNA methyltransferase [Buchnera aphidicola]|uniref:Ribosomal RNA large subunit methyltransferase E n=1 Tax=Buchnera aphidicola subsp. Tuberolachnus salignus TaxID=98804 RepID=A0A170PBX6_BUCTT|nr:SAM-dependent methyltransferase [Buchnera aphidicola]CUR53229.1 Ribosomal RNA large subunit methyltransferase E [Buchnera aphidicola (Tuberolachnus salignus)]
MILKKYSLKSMNWFKNSLKDSFIRKRNKNNLRSRAWFKLEELDNYLKIFKKGMNIVDLGSSPGSWSQYAQKKIGLTGSIIACDILPMKKISNVIFVLGDISNFLIFEKLVSLSKNKICNVIMSDIAPNISGISIIDNEKFFYLCDVVLNVAFKILDKNGILIFKLFQGVGFKEYLKKIFKHFVIVKIFKPNSSRANSREVFIIASQRKI